MNSVPLSEETVNSTPVYLILHPGQLRATLLQMDAMPPLRHLRIEITLEELPASTLRIPLRVLPTPAAVRRQFPSPYQKASEPGRTVCPVCHGQRKVLVNPTDFPGEFVSKRCQACKKA